MKNNWVWFTFLISLYSSSCSLGKLESINACKDKQKAILLPLNKKQNTTAIIIQMNVCQICKLWMSYFDDFVEALIGHHPDIRLLVIAAQQEHFHGDSKKFLELWRCPENKSVQLNT